ITYVGTVPDPAFAKALLQWAAPADDPWRPGHPSITSTTAASRDGRRVRFLHNWSWEQVTVPVPQGVRDVLSGAVHAAEVPLGPWDVKVLQDE
ncbi:Beta-galactosidase C-terminal domain, partial [Streptomyces sp. T21Q-yed]